jgi:hypothetical protein
MILIYQGGSGAENAVENVRRSLQVRGMRFVPPAVTVESGVDAGRFGPTIGESARAIAPIAAPAASALQRQRYPEEVQHRRDEDTEDPADCTDQDGKDVYRDVRPADELHQVEEVDEPEQDHAHDGVDDEGGDAFHDLVEDEREDDHQDQSQESRE